MTADVKIERRLQLEEILKRVRRAIRVVALLNLDDPLLLALLECNSRPHSWVDLQERLRPTDSQLSAFERNIRFWQNYARALETRAAVLKLIKVLRAHLELRMAQSIEAQRPT